MFGAVLSSGRRYVLLQVRKVALVVLRNIRDHRLSEPPKPTAGFAGMLDYPVGAVAVVRQVLADKAFQGSETNHADKACQCPEINCELCGSHFSV